VTVLYAVREVQIPLVAAILLGACSAKVARALRTGSVDEGLGPTALFPTRMRRPMALAMCAVEFGFGIGLIATAGTWGMGAPANCIRIGAGLLFLVATSALIELRLTKPDVGCGCFGDFSTAPVSGRTLARAALLAVASLATIDLPPIKPPATTGAAVQLLLILGLQLAIVGALSPEIGEGLIRLGYSEPCELRYVPNARTLAALRRSKAWRKYSGLISADEPTDVWRELCWRYLVYPSSYQGRPADLVFAIFLQQRRPTVHAALVDAATGLPVPWPPTSAKTSRTRPAAPSARRAGSAPAAQAVAAQAARAAQAVAAHVDIPLSNDLYAEP
jgi:hypothetical protein